MRWSEVIMVRSAGNCSEALASALWELRNDLSQDIGKGAIRFFRREKVDSDICIVLFHSGNKTKAGGSPLGLHLVSALKEFGLVNHTVWADISHPQQG